MHLTAREEHHKKLNEVERCYATIACQFGIVKGVHGKLEHSGMYVLNVLQYSLFLTTPSWRCDYIQKIVRMMCQASTFQLLLRCFCDSVR